MLARLCKLFAYFLLLAFATAFVVRHQLVGDFVLLGLRLLQAIVKDAAALVYDQQEFFERYRATVYDAFPRPGPPQQPGLADWLPRNWF